MVFTIDPDTAKDFDDSCHVDLVIDDHTMNGKIMSFKELMDLSEMERYDVLDSIKGYEIGVHIADVTHYVEN